MPLLQKHGGKIRQHGDFTCPIDGFGLLSVTVGTNKKHYTLCPKCYNEPTLEGMTKGNSRDSSCTLTRERDGL